jgi:hypothetical protein
VAGSLDGRARRVRRLETQEERRRSPTSRTQAEAWALDAEIRGLERELRAEGLDPDETLRGVDVSLPLDEHIAAIEKELADDEDH